MLGRCFVLSLWIFAWQPVVGLPPLRAAALVICLSAAMLWCYLLRQGRPGQRLRAMLGARRLGGAAGWIAVTVPVSILFNVSLATSLARWNPPPPLTLTPLDEYARLPLAWLPLSLIALAFAPLSEEIFFRGFIQRALRRRFGPAVGILLAAVAFAGFHREPWRFGYLLGGGVVFGAFVYAARSLWAGVTLHATANVAGILLDLHAISPNQPFSAVSRLPLLPEHVLLLISTGLLTLLFVRVRESARPQICAFPRAHRRVEPVL